MTTKNIKKSRRRLTPHEVICPNVPEFNTIAKSFSQNVVDDISRVIWKAYDQMKQERFIKNLDQSKQKERRITRKLEPCIQKNLSGDEPYYAQHESPELETCKSPSAHPPAYDIGFILKTDDEIIWPVECKVLQTSEGFTAYQREIEDNFMTGRYAPFTNSAGMVGYLLKGEPEQALNRIESKLGVPLKPHPQFFEEEGRPHKVSSHNRACSEAYPKAISGNFECHHLIMTMNCQENVAV